MKDDPAVLLKSPEAQLHKLILEPYQPSPLGKIQLKRHLLIIDGLDECNGDDNQDHIVNLLGQLGTLLEKSRASYQSLR